MFVATLANITYLSYPQYLHTYLNGKYHGWNGTDQAIIGAADKATDGKNNGQDQETITDRFGFDCVDSRGWLFLDSSYISGLENYTHIIYST